MGERDLKTEDFTDANHRSRSNQHGTIPEPPNTDYAIVTCTHPKQTPSTAPSIPQYTKQCRISADWSKNKPQPEYKCPYIELAAVTS